jgi:type IV pilus assembly protein PilP
MKRQSKMLSIIMLILGVIFFTSGTVFAAQTRATKLQAAPQPAIQPAAKAAAQSTTPPGTQPTTSSPLIFSFDPQGKPDPFKPFVDAEIALKKKQLEEQLKKQKKKQVALPLSPLQRFGIEQFKLVGIAGNNISRKAIIQDMNGKFYPIATGMLIGLNRAKVVEIRESSVLLEEPLTGGSKTPKKKFIEMKLRKEGDEGKP